MKILSEFIGKKMTILSVADGEEKQKRFNLNHLKKEASNEAIYEVATALGSLINGTVAEPEVSDTTLLASDNQE